MGLYKFYAAGKGEKPREVLIEADSQREATDKLRARHLTPIESYGEVSSIKSSSFSLKRSKVDTYDFTRQLAPLLDAYIPLERALGIIAEGAAEPEQKDFVNSLRRGLHEGKTFSFLVRSHGNLFPSYYANLIESGEESGCLPESVRQLYKFMGESKELKDFIVSSSIYPLAILGVTLIVSVLLFTVFVPRFAKIFHDMGRSMPPSMEFLMGVSSFASYAWWLVPLLIFGTWKILEKSYGKENLQHKTSSFVLKIPVFGRLISDLEMCRYLRTLAILIGNHVEIIKTVRIAGKIIRNPIISASFSHVDKKLKSGEKLSAALSGNTYLPPGTIPMLRVGEESGTVGEMMDGIAARLENDTRQKIKRLLSLFEPFVIIFLAVIVLIVVVSIFIAMMEINSIGQGGPNL